MSDSGFGRAASLSATHPVPLLSRTGDPGGVIFKSQAEFLALFDDVPSPDELMGYK